MLSALWVVFAAPLVQAATSVPMCGERAETVIAPPISRPASDAVLRAGPCDGRGPLGLTTRLPDRPHEPSAAPDPVPRLLPIEHRLAPVPRARLLLEAAERGDRPGHRSSIERPPR